MSDASAQLTHFDAAGQAVMVDVADKPETRRVAVAQGRIVMQAETLARIRAGQSGKGDVLGVARIAGILAAKRCADLIPLAHPIPLTQVGIEFEFLPEENAIGCIARAETVGRTGVEMEVLTAVSLALLTVYDMAKAIDRGMRITDVRLIEKRGGKSGHFRAD